MGSANSSLVVKEAAWGVVCVPQSCTGVVTRFGAYRRMASPGLRLFLPLIDNMQVLSNRTQVSKFQLEVKSSDNVFASMDLAVQWRVQELHTADALFKAQHLESQMLTQVENAVRSAASTLTLDQLFLEHDSLSASVQTYITTRMKDYGLTIEHTLVNSISPSKNVKEAMNSINASERLKIAARNEADALYVKHVREAEADRERKRLQGEGISQQRQAIMAGYTDAVDDMRARTGLTPAQVCDFVRSVQHMDVLEAIGRAPNTKTVFLDTQGQGRSATVEYACANEVEK